MSAGKPLTDEDRWPWLAEIGTRLLGDRGIIASCSALKRTYRRKLEEAAERSVLFLFLNGSREVPRQHSKRCGSSGQSARGAAINQGDGSGLVAILSKGTRTCVDRLAGDGGYTISDQMDELVIKRLHRSEMRDDKGKDLWMRFKYTTVGSVVTTT